MQSDIQIIGRIEGPGMMYLRGKRYGSLLDLGEAHQLDDGTWFFADSYDVSPFAMAIASFLHRVNHSEIIVK